MLVYSGSSHTVAVDRDMAVICSQRLYYSMSQNHGLVYAENILTVVGCRALNGVNRQRSDSTK